MRLLHTSDWHLGRTLHGVSLLEHQQVFLDWLVALAAERAVDAVLVAGDVYDRAVPTTDAVALLDRALVALSRSGVAVVMISGNHDSAIRLGFGSALHEIAGVHLRTRVADLDRPVLLHDAAGDVAVYGIPYLLPDAVTDELQAQRSHTGVLSAAADRIRADAARRGIARTVAVAHAFVTGGCASESERDISVGGIGDAPAQVFDGIGYTALGHLHGPQQIGPRIRYSGSPLAFSFSERDHHKSVTLVDMNEAGDVEVELVRAPVPRPMRQVRGRLADLLARAEGDLAALAGAWVKVVLTDPSRPAAPMPQLRRVWPHTVVLDFEPEGAAADGPAELHRVSAATDPVEICAAFVEWVDSTRPDRAAMDTLTSVVQAVRAAELSA